MRETKVKQVEGKEVATDVLATSIKEIAEAFKKIRNGRLNSKALVILLQAASGVSQREIKAVLEALDFLDEIYLKKAVAK